MSTSYFTYTASPFTMAPTTFKFQVAQLQAELTRCIEFCQDIRTTRHLDGTKNLDALQNALESAEISIPNNFNTFRRIAGSQMDVGDDKARREMNQHILDVQSKLKPRLREISQPNNRPRDKHEREKPGFRVLLTEWEIIYAEMSKTMRALSGRIETAKATPAPKPTEPKKPEPKKKNTDDITITMKEFDHLLEHMKNSWEEVISAGEIIYVNAFDNKKRTRERPEGAFIKPYPRSSRPSRTPSWEQSGKRSRVPSWETDRW